jgi:hypothetical protein
MTSPSDMQAIEMALEGVTPGPCDSEPVDEHTVRPTVATIGDYRVVRSGRGSRGYELHGADESDAAYIAACNPVVMRGILDELYALRETARKAEEMGREIAELRLGLNEIATDEEYRDLSAEEAKDVAKATLRRARTLTKGENDAQG